MALSKRDKEFHLRKITYVDFKTIEMDRVLTMLFPRLKYDGYASRRAARKSDLSLDDFINEFFRHDEKIIRALNRFLQNNEILNEYQASGNLSPSWFPELDQSELDTAKELLADIESGDSQPSVWFSGLHENEDAMGVISKWIETDLMDVVNRGRPNQAIAAPRPLHGNTYKFRNARHTRDYGAAEQIYWMLYHARQGRGQTARDALKAFFFPGIDAVTDRYDTSVAVDVETQALLHLDQQIRGDRPDTKEPERYPPLCVGQADLLAEDILRLLAYQDYMPRSVLVEYLKIIFAFHLLLYHLRLLKLLPSIVAKRTMESGCKVGRCIADSSQTDGPFHLCDFRVGVLVEMGDPTNEHMTELAQTCVDQHYRRIPNYVQAHFTLKKLDEMMDYLHKIGRMAMPAAGYFSINDILQLLHQSYSSAREGYFKSRLVGLIEEITSDGDIDPEIRQITELELNDFDTYIEILAKLRGRYHRKYITECLDAFSLKNSDAGIMRQPRRRGGQRFFSMGSKLLEVLLQIAVLTPDGSGFKTREIRIDDLMEFLRYRYGIYIDRLPSEEGFGKPSIVDQQALRKNVENFKVRLREIGFFRDLSDAFYTQTVTSRYSISPSQELYK